MTEQPLVRDRLYPCAELKHRYGRGINLTAHIDDLNDVHSAVTSVTRCSCRWRSADLIRRVTDVVGIVSSLCETPTGTWCASPKLGMRSQ